MDLKVISCAGEGSRCECVERARVRGGGRCGEGERAEGEGIGGEKIGARGRSSCEAAARESVGLHDFIEARAKKEELRPEEIQRSGGSRSRPALPR